MAASVSGKSVKRRRVGPSRGPLGAVTRFGVVEGLGRNGKFFFEPAAVRGGPNLVEEATAERATSVVVKR